MMNNNLIWRTSTGCYNNGACIEVAWRTSSHSQGQSNCVQVGGWTNAVLLRDSKNPTGPVIEVQSQDFTRFINRVKEL